MKKNVVFLGLLMSIVCLLHAQTDIDALRYSLTNFQGTARNISVGNTMSSVGADISNVHTNPAGLAKYSATEISVTPGVSFYKSNSEFLNNKISQNKIKFQLGSAGIVFGKRSADEENKKKWSKPTFAIDISRLSNYNEKYFMSGYNADNSILNAYWEKLNDRSVITDSMTAVTQYPFDASLAFALGLITIDTLGNTYTATNNGNMTQSIQINRTGGMDEAAIGIASEYKDKLMLGLSLGIPFVSYSENMILTEKDDSNYAAHLTSFSVENRLKTTGTGFNLKAGVIYSPISNLKIALSVQTPGLIFMKDRFYSHMEADYDSLSVILTADSPDGEFKYRYRQPWKMGLGASYVHKYGFVATEYELSDVSNSKFNFKSSAAADIAYENFVNSNIKNKYGLTHTLKVGTEFKIQKFRIRAGFQYRSTPFDKAAQPTAFKTYALTYSGGLGYRGNHFFVDATFVQTQTKEMYIPYTIDSSFWLSSAPEAKLSISKPAVFVTLGYKF